METEGTEEVEGEGDSVLAEEEEARLGKTLLGKELGNPEELEVMVAPHTKATQEAGAGTVSTMAEGSQEADTEGMEMPLEPHSPFSIPKAMSSSITLISLTQKPIQKPLLITLFM